MFFPQLTDVTRETLKASTVQAFFIKFPGPLGELIINWQRKIGIDRELFSW
jgi:hypothetical protein